MDEDEDNEEEQDEQEENKKVGSNPSPQHPPSPETRALLQRTCGGRRGSRAQHAEVLSPTVACSVQRKHFWMHGTVGRVLHLYSRCEFLTTNLKYLFLSQERGLGFLERASEHPQCSANPASSSRSQTPPRELGGLCFQRVMAKTQSKQAAPELTVLSESLARLVDSGGERNPTRESHPLVTDLLEERGVL